MFETQPKLKHSLSSRHKEFGCLISYRISSSQGLTFIQSSYKVVTWVVFQRAGGGKDIVEQRKKHKVDGQAACVWLTEQAFAMIKSQQCCMA